MIEKIWFGQSREWGTGGQGCLVRPDIWQVKHEVVVSD